jgi:hypothetical protein
MKRAPQRPGLRGGRKSVLVVLFVPSVERDGKTTIDQQHWVDAALGMFGRVFGGATAYPKAKGIWRDDERSGALEPRRARQLLQENGPRGAPGRDRLGDR